MPYMIVPVISKMFVPVKNVYLLEDFSSFAKEYQYVDTISWWKTSIFVIQWKNSKNNIKVTEL